MKVLWFSNTPCLASNKLAPNLVLGGWLKNGGLYVYQVCIELKFAYIFNVTFFISTL